MSPMFVYVQALFLIDVSEARVSMTLFLLNILILSDATRRIDNFICMKLVVNEIH